MRHPYTRFALLLIAVLHLFADAALAGGMVLCIGPGDHQALEVEHTPGAGCAPSSTEDPDCTDTPLHAEGEIATASQAGSHLSSAPLLLRAPGSPPKLARTSALGPRRWAPDLAVGVLAHQSTVLRL